eukprot:gene13521-14933_t
MISSSEETHLVNEIDKLQRKGVIVQYPKGIGEIISPIFLRPKSDGTYRFILNLKRTNEYVENFHFKMETIYTVLNLVKPNCFMSSIDIKDAYYSVEIDEEDQKFLAFQFQGQNYHFTCLPNGLSCGPRKFTKLMKVPLSELRKRGHLVSSYIDDLINFGDTYVECLANVAETIIILEKIGFVLHPDKSQFIPTQEIKFLGFIINSTTMRVTLSQEKKTTIAKECKNVLSAETLKIRDVAKIIGKIIVTFPAVKYGPLHFRSIESCKTKAVKFNKENNATPVSENRSAAPTAQQLGAAGLSYWREQLKETELSTEAIYILEHSLAEGTSKQYKTYISKWLQFCVLKKLDPVNASTTMGIEFLTTLFNSTGIGYSCINTARSALSLLLQPRDGLTFGNQPLVRQFMTGIFKLRPALPKYTQTYDVKVVLEYLKTIQTSIETSLQKLSMKLVTSLCLLSAQRNQSLATLDINYMDLNDSYCHFYIPVILKTTKPGRHLRPLQLNKYPDDMNLCPVALIKTYIAATAGLRKDESAFFISYTKPHKPVKSCTLARWCKETLCLAGINCTTFSAHSTRSASTSSAHSKGLSLHEINKAAGWQNAKTFANYYQKIITPNFGDTVLK